MLRREEECAAAGELCRAILLRSMKMVVVRVWKVLLLN